jgi:type 1 glutamine amidotransferase
VGVHAAIPGPQATEEKWKWYEDAYCTAFTNHSAIVPAVIRVEQTNHPSTRMLPREWRRVDEWYNFSRSPRPGVSALLALDETTYTGGTMGADHPIAWHRAIGKGRLWFTALGHTEATFAEPLFLEHLLGGILWAAGRP